MFKKSRAIIGIGASMLALALCLLPFAQEAQAGEVRDADWMAKQLKKDIKAPKSGLPIGSIIAWLGTGPITEEGYWVECSGLKWADRENFPELVDLLGRFKGVNGAWLPNFANHFQRGHDPRTGEELGRFQSWELGDHGHYVGSSSNGIGYYSGGWGAYTPLAEKDGNHISQDLKLHRKDHGGKAYWPENVAVRFYMRVK